MARDAGPSPGRRPPHTLGVGNLHIKMLLHAFYVVPRREGRERGLITNQLAGQAPAISRVRRPGPVLLPVNLQGPRALRRELLHAAVYLIVHVFNV